MFKHEFREFKSRFVSVSLYPILYVFFFSFNSVDISASQK